MEIRYHSTTERHPFGHFLANLNRFTCISLQPFSPFVEWSKRIFLTTWISAWPSLAEPCENRQRLFCWQKKPSQPSRFSTRKVEVLAQALVVRAPVQKVQR